MTITDIVIEPEEVQNAKPKRRLAKARIVIDGSLKINDIQILKNNKRMFVEFPCPQGNSSNPYIIPLNRSIRAYIEGEIIGKYLSERLRDDVWMTWIILFIAGILTIYHIY